MRYQKQEKIIGQVAQQALQQQKVLIVGMGALGSVVADMMVRAGVGTLYVMDGDLVEETNLHRQTLYTEQDAINESPKVYAAEKQLKGVNRHCTIVPIFAELNEENAQRHIKQVDLVIDGTDNLQTRYVINDACFRQNVPWVYGAASGVTGSYFAFVPKQTPCFRCLFGDMEEAEGANCSTEGVLPSTTHLIATLQFNEALKYLTGHLHLLNRQLERIDVWQNEHLKMNVRKRATCRCGHQIANSDLATSEEVFELKTLCGKEVIMARFREKKQAESTCAWLLHELDKKTIPYVSTPYFHTAMIQDTKVRLFQDGRIYFYHAEKAKAQDILLQWIH